MEKAKEQEYVKEIRRLEKRNKDLLDQIGDEQLKLMTLTDAYDKLQVKMKAYKGQIEGAVSTFKKVNLKFFNRLIYYLKCN